MRYPAQMQQNRRGFQTRPYGVMPNNGRWWVRDEL